MGPMQEMPVFESRVQLDPRVKDLWGIPVARLSGDKHPHTLEIGTAHGGKAEAWLQGSRRRPDLAQICRATGSSGGQHQAGTCRMGNDPKTSVVNRYCQVHDVDNVFVVDGSVHVTNGGFNPALTILANAYRASDHLVQRWKGRGLAMRRFRTRLARPLSPRAPRLACPQPASTTIPPENLARDVTKSARAPSWQTFQSPVSQLRSLPRRFLTTDPGFHLANARRLVKHMRGDVPEPIRLRKDLNSMVERCQKCHQQEFAAVAERPAWHHVREHLPRSQAQPQPPLDGRLPALPRHVLRRWHARTGRAAQYRRSLAAPAGSVVQRP